MRLLELDESGDISLTEHADNVVPPYAILSHTWGKEEVTYDDVVHRRGHGKAGYQKIRFCAEQAKQDGIHYSWVDTCCINKANYTELSESINSMYRWYRQAERCYVYLSDVSSRKHRLHDDTHDLYVHTQRTWEPSFRTSRWFTRGWTLQELLAPASVEFFSYERQLLGSKGSLATLIQNITTIPDDALRSTSLSDFSIQERFRWAAMRDTTKAEDKAYCLLGIFNVFIAPIYGEGDNALVRLRDEISKKHGIQLQGVESLPILREPSNPQSIRSQTQSSVLGDVSSPDRTEELLNFLGFEQMDSRRRTVRSAYASTCAWLLKTPKYMDWLDPEKFDDHYGFLWVMGKPGAGKSTLVKFAHAQASKSPRNGEILISYFFNARGDTLEKSTLGMYRSLLFQLLRKAKDLQEVFSDIPTSVLRAPQFTWTIEQLRELLTSAVRALGSSRMKCFIDALDECVDEQEIRDMITHFEDLGQISRGRFHVFFASRHYPTIDIRRGMKLVLEDESGHDDDLARYVKNHLRVGKGKVLEDVKTQVHVKANGVFLWTALVVDILNEEFRRGRIHAVQKRLHEIPAGLSDLFRDILRRDRTNMDDLLLCIQWVLFAKRPLNLKEFYFAMLYGSSWSSDIVAEWDPELVCEDDMKRFVLDCSKGLAEITLSSKSIKSSKGPTVQFIHESVTDFLIKDGGLYDLWPELKAAPESLSHLRLSKCCEKYLTVDLATYVPSRDAIPRASSDSGAELRKVLNQKFPFLTYAAEQMFYHAESAASAPAENGFLTEFNLDNWIFVMNLVEPFHIRRHTPKAPMLYLLAELNCVRLIKKVRELDLPLRPSSEERYRHPFFAALMNKHWDAIRALLESPHNVDVEAAMEELKVHEDLSIGRSPNPFHWALCQGQERLAELLATSIDIDIRETEKRGQIPFVLAAKKGYKGVVQLLMSHRMAEISIIARDFTNALLAAVQEDRMEVVRLLLAAAAHIRAQGDPLIDMALHYAVRRGNKEVVQLLLDARANVYAVSGLESLLISALVHGHQEAMRLLPDAEADANAVSGSKSPLCITSMHGYQEVIRLLIDAGADANAVSSLESPLYVASKHGHQEMVRLLIDAGADANAVSGLESPLYVASKHGHQEVVRLLIDAGADANAVSNFESPLYVASKHGHQEVVRLLIDAGADVAWAPPQNNAIQNHHMQLMRLEQQYKKQRLLARQRQNSMPDPCDVSTYSQDMDMNARIATQQFEIQVQSLRQQLRLGFLPISTLHSGTRALVAASKMGHWRVVQLLLDRDVDVNAPGIYSTGDDGTPLEVASARGHFDIVQLLLARGADIGFTPPYKYGHSLTALYAASQAGHAEIVRQLLSKGANVYAPGGTTGSALGIAVMEGHGEVVQLLLSAGAQMPTISNGDS